MPLRLRRPIHLSSGSEAGSYFRLIDCVYHLSVITKKKKKRVAVSFVPGGGCSSGRATPPPPPDPPLQPAVRSSLSPSQYPDPLGRETPPPPLGPPSKETALLNSVRSKHVPKAPVPLCPRRQIHLKNSLLVPAINLARSSQYPAHLRRETRRCQLRPGRRSSPNWSEQIDCDRARGP